MRPRLLVVEDEPTIADGLRLVLESEGYDVEVAGTTVAALVRVEEQPFAVALVDLVLPDGDGLHLLRLLKGKAPDLAVIIMTAHSSIAKAVEATKQGAFHFVAKPFEPEEITALVAAALEHRRLVVETSDLRRRLAGQGPSGEILGSAPAMKHVFDLLEAVADSDANVLVVGESGTGKELVANAVHGRSPRAGGSAREDQLRGPAPGPDGVGAVRLRARGVHRRRLGQARAARGGPQGFGAPRRDRRDAVRPPGEAPARARGPAGAPPRRRAQRRPWTSG